MKLCAFKHFFIHSWQQLVITDDMRKRGVIGYRACLNCRMEQIKKEYYGWSENGWREKSVWSKETQKQIDKTLEMGEDLKRMVSCNNPFCEKGGFIPHLVEGKHATLGSKVPLYERCPACHNKVSLQLPVAPSPAQPNPMCVVCGKEVEPDANGVLPCRYRPHTVEGYLILGDYVHLNCVKGFNPCPLLAVSR